jgi:hypothetical protein
VNQTANGTRTTLHYPIVTEPSQKRRRRSDGSRGISATLRKATREFLGLDSDDSDQESLWTERRIRLANRLYGGVVDSATAAATLTLPRPRRSRVATDALDDAAAAAAHYCAATTYPRYKRSVVNYVADGLTTLGRRISGKSAAAVSAAETAPTTTLSRSFPPGRDAAPFQGPADETDSGAATELYGGARPELFFDRGRPEPAGGRITIGPAALNIVHPVVPSAQVGLGRIGVAAVDVVDKRVYGMGVVGEVTGRDFQTLVRSRPHVQQQMDEMDDYRPYFTYWVTSVQVKTKKFNWYLHVWQ